MKRLQRYFLEKNDVVVAVILQAHVAFVGTAAALGLEVKLFFGNGLALGVVGDFYVVEDDDGMRAVEGDEHGVPLGAGFAGAGERLGEGVERSGDVVFVFLGIFGLIVDLDFVAVMDRHPRLAGLDGDANENAGIVIVVAHLVDDANAAVAHLVFGPIQQAHAAVRLDEAVFRGHVAGADVLPANEVL